MRIEIDGAGEFEAARVQRHEGGVEIGVVDVQHRNWSSGWKDLNAHFACKAQAFKRGDQGPPQTEYSCFSPLTQDAPRLHSVAR